ncbi:MAG: hypothetical protein AMJ78_02250 [Omnitrophica WOR_2 bacterium SM23_29]|nr:MAG: hypothetical protein AMJ78_02250 [Omnitrophica WOR_2 bacterium SM23_29]
MPNPPSQKLISWKQPPFQYHCASLFPSSKRFQFLKKGYTKKYALSMKKIVFFLEKLVRAYKGKIT